MRLLAVMMMLMVIVLLVVGCGREQPVSETSIPPAVSAPVPAQPVAMSDEQVLQQYPDGLGEALDELEEVE